MHKLVLFTLFAMNLVEQPAPEVKIQQGILSGKISDDGLFFEYLGIPYATTNSSTRFQAPLLAPSWEGVFKATQVASQCAQYYPKLGVMGIEDCLKINVYVPAKARKPLPVMVYIHGGGFTGGSGGNFMIKPDFIIRHDVIMVTFNYRLGVLGFLCLNIKEAPGNAGMKDQVAALRWVKKNIANFGGDPDNITIFGHSAGGTSVALLVASNITEGLFQKAIIHSGSSLANWATNRQPVFLATTLAKYFGHNIIDPKELYDLFLVMSYKDLIVGSSTMPLSRQLTSHVLHLPCVEIPFPGVEPFLIDYPYVLLKRKPKNISLMYGSTNKEELYLISEETDDTLDLGKYRNLFSDDLVFESKEEEVKVAADVKEYYFGKKDISRRTLMNLSDLYGDLYFEMPMLLEAEIMAETIKAPIYVYYFTYSGGRNMVKYFTGFEDENGACHGDDILYMFKSSIWPFKVTRDDQKIIDWMTKTTTNFAKYGNPTPDFVTDLPIKWLPNDRGNLRFMYIGNELKMGSMPKPDSFQFWKNIYEKYRRI